MRSPRCSDEIDEIVPFESPDVGNEIHEILTCAWCHGAYRRPRGAGAYCSERCRGRERARLRAASIAP